MEREFHSPEWECAGECGRTDLKPIDASSQEPTFCQKCYDEMVEEGRI